MKLINLIFIFLFSIFSIEAYSQSTDTDGDGILDHLDLDSDNDGILNCIENGFDGNPNTAFKSNADATAFTNPPGGSAPINQFRLTNGTSQRGQAWSYGKIDFADSFTITMKVLSSDADGMAIVFQNDPLGISATGIHGQGLGARGIANGIALELDTFANSCDNDANNGGNCDPNYDHGSIRKTAGTATTGWTKLAGDGQLGDGTVDDGLWHKVVVTWDATTRNLSYTFDGTPVTNYTFPATGTNAIETIFGGTTNVRFGFTGSTRLAGSNNSIGFDNPCEIPLYFDTDGDGIPDYLDLDSDNDGCYDSLEGDGAHINTDLNDDGSINTTIYPIDANGVPNNGNSQGIGQSQNSTIADCDCPGLGLDSDGDGIYDDCDLDDDNDGILDTVECPTTYLVRPVTTASTTVTGVITSGNARQIVDGEGGGGSGAGPFPYWYTNVSNLPIAFNMNMQAVSTIDHIKLYDPWGIDEWIKNFRVQLYNSSNVLLGTENLTAPNQYLAGSNPILSFSQEYSGVTRIRFTILSGQGYNSFGRVSVNEIVFLDLQPMTCDTDGDGIPDFLDLDSDNDGCYDALEGDGSYIDADLNPNGSINVTTYPIDSGGVPDNGNSQGIGQSQNNAIADCDCPDPSGIDTDGDGIDDTCDLDDDNDGILDSDECGESNIIKRGDFTNLPGSPGFFTPAQFETVNPDWVFTSTAVGSGPQIFWGNITTPIVFGNGIQFRRDGETQSLTQSLSNLFHYERPQVLISKFAANNSNSAGNSSTLILSYAGVEYMRIVTANGMNASSTLTYSNGASGSLTNIAVGTIYNNWTIDLPYGVTDSGELKFEYIAGPFDSDDFSLGDIVLNTCQDTDEDGIPNYQDLDSDGDGCPDALEGDENVSPSNLNADGSIHIIDNGGLDSDGVPNLVNTGGDADTGDDQGQGIGDSQDENIKQCFCTENPNTDTPDGFTKIGVSTMTKQPAGWPENIANGWITMDSKTQGFVITRTQHVGGTDGIPAATDSIEDPQEGMLVYDIDDACVKLFNGTIWNCIKRSCNTPIFN